MSENVLRFCAFASSLVNRSGVVVVRSAAASLMFAQAEVKRFAPLAASGADTQRTDLIGGEHAVETRAFDIEDLAAQRQHRLIFAVTALL
ncbi:hypothetical protein ACDH52_20300, partial [Xanthomonas fragariae]